MISVFKADSIIQRDALLHALSSAGINASSPPRDISRKVTPTTVDIAYEGYSAFFDGFDIQVLDPDEQRAREVVAQFIREFNINVAPTEKPARRYLQGFYFCSLFSLIIPFVFHAMAIYNLVQGMKAGERLSIGKTILSVVVLSCGFISAYYIVGRIFEY